MGCSERVWCSDLACTCKFFAQAFAPHVELTNISILAVLNNRAHRVPKSGLIFSLSQVVWLEIHATLLEQFVCWRCWLCSLMIWSTIAVNSISNWDLSIRWLLGVPTSCGAALFAELLWTTPCVEAKAGFVSVVSNCGDVAGGVWGTSTLSVY